MDDVFDIGVSFSQKTAPRSAPMDISSVEFCPLLCQRGKDMSVLDKEECSTNVGTKLLMVCSFCGDLPWAPYAIRHLTWEGLNTHQGRLRGRKRRLGKAWVFQWLQPPPDASGSSREAGPGVVPCSFGSPSPAPFPTSPVYTDGMLAPTMRP